MGMFATDQMRKIQAAVTDDNRIFTTLGIFICEILSQLKEKFISPARITGLNIYLDFEE